MTDPEQLVVDLDLGLIMAGTLWIMATMNAKRGEIAVIAILGLCSSVVVLVDLSEVVDSDVGEGGAADSSGS